jgi:hypothetical protein
MLHPITIRGANDTVGSGRRRRLSAVLCTVVSLTVLTAGATAEPVRTFADAGRDATSSLLGVWYAGDGAWRACNAADCATGNSDWGYDSLTYVLAGRYTATHDRRLLGPLRALVQSAPTYPAPCTAVSGCDSWSDVPEWDAIALMDEYTSTRNPAALAKAEAAFAFVESSSAYALGACPRILYQQPGGALNQLKTLETDANLIKAALLLYGATHGRSYLAAARSHYDAVRAYYLDASVALYSVYVFDDGSTCTQVPRRFFASVNGDMIWSGVELWRDTGDRAYLDQAISTGRAVDQRLGDARGIFTDLQAENDIVQPLVEGMAVLAWQGHAFARAWILRNAAAALSARAKDGSFGRFFDGPAPDGTITAWQANGGLALEIAAAQLAPKLRTPGVGAWASAATVSADVTALPSTITIEGSGVALLGMLGEQCCEAGHARVVIDGRETFDQTGIWQNKSSSGRSIPGAVLFVWRWPTGGSHTLTFEPGVENGKEGGAFLHLTGYELVP